MNYLFIHQDYPGQFRHLVANLAVKGGNHVVALVDKRHMRTAAESLPERVRLIAYESPTPGSRETHRYLYTCEAAVRRGQQVLKSLIKLKDEGYTPDFICAHIGWGESLFLKELYPNVPVLGYFEFFYRAQGADVGFDHEFYHETLDDICRIKMRNAHHLLAIESCDWGLTPTKWQASQLPQSYLSKVSVIHEGIDTNHVKPDHEASFKIQQGLTLTSKDKVVTFVNRNLEPYRGFHIFMRALPAILQQCPDAHVVLVGGDEVSYGRKPAEGGSWRQFMMKEVGQQLDMQRVHFVGNLPYERYLNLLQVSSAHVYLTYPFVLSWSLLESMSAGCLVIASETAPVQEVIVNGKNGLLVDFFNHTVLAEKVCEALTYPERFQLLRNNARQTIIDGYDLHQVCLPRQVALIAKLKNEGLH
jgi:glycosyltransferase involved in cell wall biosynthesis